MYLYRPRLSWLERVVGSARTLAAILVTAVLASALTVHWSDASATGSGVLSNGAQGALTGIPVTVEGRLVGAGDGLVAIVERGAESPIAFAVDGSASLLREGQPIALEDLRAGDAVRLTINGLTGSVLRLHASPAGSGLPLRVPGSAAFLAALGLIAAATLLAYRNSDHIPALPSRVGMTRFAPVTAHR